MTDLENITSCPNCGQQPFNRSYCPECGQRKLTQKDYSAISLFWDFLGDVLSIENKVFRTFGTLLSKPSRFAREYLRGARKKFISPIKLFIFANAIYFLFPAADTFKTTLDTQLNNLHYSHLTHPIIQSIINGSGMSFDLFSTKYNALTNIVSKALLILLPIIFGVFSWMLAFRQKTKRPIIHHWNYSLILFAFFILFGITLIPAIYYYIATIFDIQSMVRSMTERNLTLYIFGLINFFGIALYQKFFSGRRFAQFARLLALNLLFIPLIILYRFILLWVTLGWMKLFG